MTTAAASKYLGIQLRTLYRMIEFGLLPAHRMGRMIFFRTEEVEAFLDSEAADAALAPEAQEPEPSPR